MKPAARPRRSKLLVIDDETINLRLMNELLEDLYDVYVATNVRDALAVSRRNPPDLVLLDIAMPDMTGLEACRMFKQQSHTRLTPVIFVTAKDTATDLERCFESGGVDFIAKPVHPVVLRARVGIHVTLAAQARELRAMALIDEVTGVSNRRAFNKQLDTEYRACRRERVPLTLLLLDVDCFKAYNDCYGHLAGDAALRAVASVIEKTLRRPRDFVARYGGEEFACVLPNTNLGGAAIVAEMLRAAVDGAGLPHEASSAGPNLTVSVGGTASIPHSDQDALALISAADANLYRAKHSGRNRVCVRGLDSAEEGAMAHDR